MGIMVSNECQLKMIRGGSNSTRKRIWFALNELRRAGIAEVLFSALTLEPQATRIIFGNEFQMKMIRRGSDSSSRKRFCFVMVKLRLAGIAEVSVKRELSVQQVVDLGHFYGTE